MTYIDNKQKLREILLGRVVPVLLVILCLLGGMYYAASRNIRNGSNAAAVSTEEAEISSRYPIAKGETLEQRVIAYHDFDGVSLLLDHSGASLLRSVRVSVIRESTGEVLLTRSIPVWLIDKNQYTFFASGRTIAVSEPEFYVIRIESSGVGGGLITAAAGTLPSELAAGATSGGTTLGDQLFFGFVTDYQRRTSDCVLTGIAVVILCLWILWAAAKRERGRRFSRDRAAFAASCYALLLACTLLALTYSRTPAYSDVYIGGYDNFIEVTDDTPVDLSFTVPEGRTAGISIDQINTGDLTFTNETIEVTLTDVLTGRVVQSRTYRLADLDREPAVDEPDSLYFAFSDRYNPGTRLMIHVAPHGLFSKGISIGTSSSAACDAALYVVGEKQDYVLSSHLSTYTYHSGAGRVLSVAAAAAVFGAVLFLYAGKRRMPLVLPGSRQKAGGHRGSTVERRARRSYAGAASVENGQDRAAGRRRMAGFILAAVSGLVITEWGWASAISDASRALTPVVVSQANQSEEWNAVPGAESAVTQNFTSEENHLAGIGLEISDKDLTSDSIASIGDMNLHVILEDENGSVLLDQETPVSSMRTVNAYTNGQFTDSQNFLWNEARQNLEQHYRYLAFEHVIPDARGQTYQLRIYTDSDNPGRMLIAQKPASAGGAANLLAVYQDYDELPALFWSCTLAALAVLLILYWLTGTKGMRVETLFLITALTFGVLYSFVIPPYYSNDEVRHMDTVYALSNRFLGTYQAVGRGFLMERAQDAGETPSYMYAEVARIYRALSEDLFRVIPESGRELTAAPAYDVLSNSNGWTYLPATIGFSIARSLGLSLMTAIMFARWGLLVVSKILIFLGIRKCPVGKRGLAAAALFPMVLQLTGAVGYDAMILAYAFLFIGYAMHILLERESVSVLDVLILAVSGALLLSNKQGVYFPVILLILLLPLVRKERIYKIADAVIVGAGIVLVLVRAAPYFLKGVDAAGGAGATYSIAWLAAHPVRTVNMILSTAAKSGDVLFTGAVGSPLGFNHLNLPYYLIALIVLIAWIAARQKDQDTVKSLRIRMRVSLGVLAVIGILVFDIVFLVTMTYYGNQLINGLVGRYFIPYVLLILLLLSGGRRQGTMRNPDRLIFYMGAVHFYIVVYAFYYLFTIGVQ